MMDNVNPHWRRWYNGLDPADKARVDAKWEEILADPSIPSGNKNAPYARMAMLLDWCVAELRYEKQR